MNKYEQLIEFIINEQEDKARELFHQIVVEKSRDIYESLIDEEDFDEAVGGNQVTGLVDEINADEQGMQEADDELGMDSDADLGGELGGDDLGGDDLGGELGGDDLGGEGDIEDRVMDLESALDELKAEFDALMADEEGEGEHNDGIGDPDFGGDDMGGDDMGGEEDEMPEGFVREYVENVGQVYKGKLDPTADNLPVGAKGDRPPINKQSIVAGKNDMGGSSANIVKGGTEQSADGKPVPTPNNEYTKKRGELPGAGNFENVPGAKTKGYTNKATSYEKQHGKEGQTTDGKLPVDKKSLSGGKVR